MPFISPTDHEKPTVIDDQLAALPELRELIGTIFIVPIDAPLPKDLEELTSKGPTLLSRLLVLDREPESFAMCPLTGQEMFDIASCFSALTTAKKVVLLEDLPGARYDALMTQGVRRAGLRALQWPRVSELIEQRRRLEQRTADSQPWRTPTVLAPEVQSEDQELGPI